MELEFAVRHCLFIIISSIVLSGCTKINKNPDILLNEPYQRVKYIANPGISYRSLDVIQVTTSGLKANILNTIPLLYKKALDSSGNMQQTIIGNITISSFTKNENFQVSFQECISVPETKSVPKTTCNGGSCNTTYTTQTQYNQRCTTRYKTEIRDVLYQKATADILIPIKEI